MTYNKIMERLQHDYAVTRAKYEVLGVFLSGSQNYNCQTETSDIDTKVIVIPTLDEMILGHIKINETIPRGGVMARLLFLILNICTIISRSRT